MRPALFAASLLGVLAIPCAAAAEEPATDPLDPTATPAEEPADPIDDPYGGDTLDDEPAPTVSTRTSSEAIEPVGPAPADDSGGGIRPFDGRFGVGAIRTIAGLNGVNFRYFITDKFAVGFNTGVALFAYRENDPASNDMCPGEDCELEETRTVAAMGFGLEALYYAKLGRAAGQLPFRADFGLGGRFGVITVVNANDVPDDLDDLTELHIELPLIVQLMFGDNFALAPEFGMDFAIVPGSRADGDSNPGLGRPGQIAGAVNGPGFGWEITRGVGLFAGASMHYYF